MQMLMAAGAPRSAGPRVQVWGSHFSCPAEGPVEGAPLWWLREAQQQSRVLAPAGPEAGQESL